MTKKLFLLFSILLFLFSTELLADEPKRALKANYQLNYLQKPKVVTEIDKLLTEGQVYGRIRSNSFYFWWDSQDSSHDTQFISGLGGSLVYKTATMNDLSFMAGFYYSTAFFDDNNDPVGALKPGKDTLSRFNYINSGRKDMSVLAQANFSYTGLPKSEIIFGRQIVETFYTKSNDSKMVPNTFEAIVLNTKIIPKTKIKLGYLNRQKLRDHTKFHSVLMYGDSTFSSSLKPNWTGNDDAAMHKGLTYNALVNAGKPTDSELIVGDIHNKSIQNLKIDASFYVVPELLSSIMTELNYKFKLENGISITPGIRYINQIDHGAGKVGGASYSGQTVSAVGYKDADSLDSQMLALRLVAKIDNYKINLGYSNIFDEADLIAPWRGFPTAGYTRSMARYNWRANTKSYRLEVTKNANSKGIYKNLFIQSSILFVDGDEDKLPSSHTNDHMYYYLGFIQNIPTIPDLQWRLRLGFTQYLRGNNDQFNNLDSRFELNYLF